MRALPPDLTSKVAPGKTTPTGGEQVVRNYPELRRTAIRGKSGKSRRQQTSI